jgi:magnesium transporter
MGLEEKLADDLIDRHPSDAAAVLETLDFADGSALLGRISPERATKVLRLTTAHSAAELLARMQPERASEIVGHLPLDVAVVYLRKIAEEVRNPILAATKALRARSIRALLQFAANTAGALMDPEVLAIREDLLVRDAIERVHASAENARYNVYVVDQDDRLVGVLNLRELLLAKPERPLSEITHGRVERIAANAGWRAIVDHPGWQIAHTLPVVDPGSGVYLGAIRYRTLRMLESRDHSDARSADVAVGALGELFAAGVGGFIGSLGRIAAPEPGPRRPRADGD